MEKYLELSRQGKNEWWRYTISVLVIIFIWQVMGSIPYGLFLLWGFLKNPQTDFSIQFIQEKYPLANFSLLMLGAACLVIGVYIAVRLIHNRKVRSLITPEKEISWKRILQGFFIWLVLSAIFSLLEALIHPGRYIWTFTPQVFLPFALLALVLVPIQTTGEELFFRGYLLQGFGHRINNIWFLSCLSGIFFMVPHLLNPEASLNYFLMGLFYFSMGFFLGFITLYDGRLELAIGVHAANNLFSFLFANSTITVIPSPSIFTINGLDVVYSLVVEIIGIFFFIFLLRLEKKNQAASE